MSEGTGKSKIVLGTIISKIQIILGILITGFFGLGLIGCIGQKNSVSVIVVIIVFTALGIWLILKGVKKGRLIKRFKQYVAVLSGDPLRSLDNLAATLGEGFDSVRRNVEQMIKQGIMANAYINRDTNCIVFAGQAPCAAATGAKSAPGRPD